MYRPGVMVETGVHFGPNFGIDHIDGHKAVPSLISGERVNKD